MVTPILSTKLCIPPPRPNSVLRLRLSERLKEGLHRKLTLISARLEALHRGNLFVVPLDDTRQWYRYHHLFAEVLQAHVRTEQPELVPTLHQRASAWYQQHGLMADAIPHALAAEDFARAADLLGLAVPAMRDSRQEAAVLSWLRPLPDQVAQVRPVLCVAYAWSSLAVGELAGVEKWLRSAERWIDTTVDRQSSAQSSSGTMIVVDEETRR